MPVAPQRVQSSASQVIDTVAFHRIERIDTNFEGFRVAAVIRLVVSAQGSAIRQEMLLYNIWELDEDGTAK